MDFVPRMSASSSPASSVGQNPSGVGIMTSYPVAVSGFQTSVPSSRMVIPRGRRKHVFMMIEFFRCNDILWLLISDITSQLLESSESMDQDFIIFTSLRIQFLIN